MTVLEIQDSPPHSMEAEQGLLGSILISPEVLSEVIQTVKLEHFYVPTHQTIFSELSNLWEKKEKYDLITFTSHLRDAGVLEQIGGAAYVTSLFTAVPSAINYRFYMEIVLEKSKARDIIAHCARYARMVHLQEGEVPDILNALQAELLAVAEGGDGRVKKTIRQIVQQSIEAIQNAIERRIMLGLGTGLPALDMKLGGMKPGQLIVVAGETGEGKTALALNIVEHNAMNGKTPCAIVSLEMDAPDLCERLIASHARVDIHDLIVSEPDEGSVKRILDSSSALSDAPLYIRDDADVDPLKLRAIGRDLKRQKIELLVVDYVQLMTPMATKDESRERAVSASAHALKQMAKELQVVVLALSQVNDEKRLRESRAIGHHADKVMVIEHKADQCFIKVIKNRQGPVGPVEVQWLPWCARFQTKI